FHDAQLFAGRTKDDPDFAGANPTVYPKSILQFNSISLPPGRECAVTPYFPGSQSPDSTVASLAGTLWHRRSCDCPRRRAHTSNREPTGSCRQHFYAGKTNLVIITPT